MSMSCQDLVELVTAYFDGVLPPELRAAFEAHAAECSGCAAYLEQMRTTIRIMARL
jgi:anti-sigma factor RsiW